MIKYIIIVFTIIGSFNTVNASIAQAPNRTLEQYSVTELIEHFASQYKVSAQKMLATMKCESSLNTKAIGDHGNSYGIAQIHLPSHPDISIKQAENPIFASEWTAKEFSKGHQSQWTCYRNLYLKG